MPSHIRADDLPHTPLPTPRTMACAGGRAGADCATRVSSHALCTTCSSCADCCTCAPTQRPFTDGGPLTMYGDGGGAFPRHVGVEIECGLPRFAGPLARLARLHMLTVKSDGSVGSSHRRASSPPPQGMRWVANSQGVEVATQAMAGDAAETLIATVGEALRFHRAHTDTSCGLHVHVNCRGATWDDIGRLARLWVKVEPALWNAVAPSRRRNREINHYTRAIAADLERAGIILASTPTEKEAAISAASATGDGPKYHALNFSPLGHRGTVEVRMHHGTVNPTKIRQWAASMCQIVHFALTHTDVEVDALRGTPSEVLTAVLQPEQGAWMAARREHFAALRSRIHHGEAPRRRRGATTEPRPPPPPPGPREGSEV